jgi:hypothetical protein
MVCFVVVEGAFNNVAERFEDLDFDAQDKRDQALLVIRSVYNRSTKEGEAAYQKAEADIERTYQDERGQALMAFLETYHTEVAALDNLSDKETNPEARL